MRSLIILGAAASLLTLAACNRDAAEETPAPASDMGADASATGSGSSASTTPAASDSGPAPYTAGAAAPSPEIHPDGPTAHGPVTDATRAGAKEKAESTNLHP